VTTEPEPTRAGPQIEPAVTPREPPPAARRVLLDAAQRALLAAVLNRIVPPRGELPGAGDLEVGAHVEAVLATSLELRRLVLEGLREIEIASARRAGRPFVALGPAEQTAVLEAVEESRPACFAALVEHTYRGYYTQPRVLEAIGYGARPPQPLGRSLPPFDPALLARQRERAPFWRRTG
jgi:Gluconate 2-dehydrogenase subunit 3